MRVFCIQLANFYKYNLSDSLSQSTESPILFRSYGHEIPFSDQKGASKIGDSVLCAIISCVRVLVDQRNGTVGRALCAKSTAVVGELLGIIL